MASKAAKSRSAMVTMMSDIPTIKSKLEDLFDGVLSGRLDRSAAAVGNQICNSLLRAAEIERRVRVEDELEIRLDQLEDLLEQAEERSRYGGR